MDYSKFKPVVFKGLERSEYEVNGLGQVRRTKDHEIVKPISHPSGYQVVALKLKTETWFATVHKLVADTFIYNDKPESKVYINHKDGNLSNNEVSNLERSNISTDVIRNTESEEIPDEVIHKICSLLELEHYPSRISESTGVDKATIKDIALGKFRIEISEMYNIPEVIKKISDERAEEICKLLVKKLSDKEIAEICNVSKNVVSEIAKGRTHKKVSAKFDLSDKRRPNSILTDALIHQICRYIDLGYTAVAIAEILDITDNPVKDIKCGRYCTKISKDYKFMQGEKKERNNFTSLYPEIDRMILSGYKTKEIVKALNIPDEKYQSFKSLIVKRRNMLKSL